MVNSLMRLAPLDGRSTGYELEYSDTQRGTAAAAGRERKQDMSKESSSTLGRVSAAGGASNPGPRQWKDSSEAHRVSRRSCGRAVTEEVVLEVVGGDKPRME